LCAKLADRGRFQFLGFLPEPGLAALHIKILLELTPMPRR